MLSVIVSSQLQQNGTYLVHESHTSESGIIIDHTYFADDETLIDDVCNARGQQIQAELDRQAVIDAEATSFEIPIFAVELRKRITPTELAAFAASTDTNVKYFFNMFEAADYIYRTDPATQQGLDLLIAHGILEAARKAEILA